MCEGGAKGYTRHPRGPRDTDETRPRKRREEVGGGEHTRVGDVCLTDGRGQTE